MPISHDGVRHLMSLVRLKLPEAEVARLGQDLDSILGHVQQLQQVDVSAVQPMTHAVPATLQVREDEQVLGLGPKGLEGSAGREGAFVRVPKIVE
ncbi:MAG: Asp-tRNA(Asn)/Glu-tRNA(Gln) amidotransferase subunit GatC [Myxococcota bacterium]